jgi:hypothetical protein
MGPDPAFSQNLSCSCPRKISGRLCSRLLVCHQPGGTAVVNVPDVFLPDVFLPAGSAYLDMYDSESDSSGDMGTAVSHAELVEVP